MNKILLYIGFFALLSGCDRHEPVLPDNPEAATLLFPYNNSLCNQGTNVTATESTISFDWEESDYTDSYDLKVKDLVTGSSVTIPVAKSDATTTLERGKPYSWVVISKSAAVTVTAESQTWKFYIAGDGIVSYAPFPAEIISPPMADTVVTASNVITLDWNGGDVDNDITGYDVYFGTASIPPLFRSNVTASIITDAPVSANTIYFWKIITKDSKGNTSDSGIFQFRVQ